MNAAAVDPRQSVAYLVLEHAGCARVLHAHHIDYCCRGGATLKAAAQERGLDLDALIEELGRAIETGQEPAQIDLRQLSTADLIEHIVSTHHCYTRTVIPLIRRLAAKVAKAHGERNDKLLELARLVDELAINLLNDFHEEEQVLFPMLLADSRDEDEIAKRLAAMVADHFEIARLLKRLRAAADNFEAPDWACSTYQSLLCELRSLERDIYAHAHVENHVLEPRFSPPEDHS